jgi:hypothetical protein
MNKNNRRLVKSLTDIQQTFSSRGYGKETFMLWRGEQMAIGEIMTEGEATEESFCVWYMVFTEKFRENASVLRNFLTLVRHEIEELIKIPSSIARVATEIDNRAITRRGDTNARLQLSLDTARLVSIQHLLLDLSNILDPQYSKVERDKLKHIEFKPDGCQCSACKN